MQGRGSITIFKGKDDDIAKRSQNSLKQFTNLYTNNVIATRVHVNHLAFKDPWT